MNSALTLSWPAGIDVDQFLQHYWQQRPLFFEQAFENFQSPVNPDDLAYFATVANSTPRLIVKEQAAYRVEHGPFAEHRFTTLTENNWSLLVSDVEKHWPELAEYLEPFGFLPSWRIDDLMISYAPEGASVGAHVDAYDVFLLQATGEREWLIDSTKDKPYKTNRAGDLLHIDGFEPSHTYRLGPGDMLYLPPGVAHHGIARSDNCTTWSVGFRAPSRTSIIEEFTTGIIDRLPDGRFGDACREKVTTPGEISAEDLNTIKKLWSEAVQLEDDAFQELAGALLTVPHALIEDNLLEYPTGAAIAGASYTRNPFSRLAFIPQADEANLYADGNAYRCSLHFAQMLCSPAVNIEAPGSDAAPSTLSVIDYQLFNELVDRGVLVEVDATP